MAVADLISPGMSAIRKFSPDKPWPLSLIAVITPIASHSYATPLLVTFDNCQIAFTLHSDSISSWWSRGQLTI